MILKTYILKYNSKDVSNEKFWLNKLITIQQQQNFRIFFLLFAHGFQFVLMKWTLLFLQILQYTLPWWHIDCMKSIWIIFNNLLSILKLRDFRTSCISQSYHSTHFNVHSDCIHEFSFWTCIEYNNSCTLWFVHHN